MKRLKEKRKLRRQREQARHHFVHSRGCFLCDLQECYSPRRNGKTIDPRSMSEIFNAWDVPNREWWQDILLYKMLDFSKYHNMINFHRLQMEK